MIAIKNKFINLQILFSIRALVSYKKKIKRRNSRVHISLIFFFFFFFVQRIHSLRILQEQNRSGSFNFEKIQTRFIVWLSLIFSSLQMLASAGLQVALYQPVQVSKGKTYHLVMAIQFFWSRAGLGKLSDTACCKKDVRFHLFVDKTLQNLQYTH